MVNNFLVQKGGYFHGEMEDCNQENLKMEIGGIYGDDHLIHIRNQWAFRLSHSCTVDGDVTKEYNGECYGQFYPPIKDKQGNWWLWTMPVNAEPSDAWLDYHEGKLCLQKHCHSGYQITDMDGHVTKGYYEEPYSARDLSPLQVFPRGTDVSQLPNCVPESKIRDGKLNCHMLYQAPDWSSGLKAYVYYTR